MPLLARARTAGPDGAQDIDDAALAAAAAEARRVAGSSDASVHSYRVDVSARESVYAAAAQMARDAVPEVSVLVNNAGVVTGRALLDAPDASIERTLRVNTLAHIWLLKAFLPAMLLRDHGHIVTVASSAGLVGVAGLVDYCASKFGAVGLDEALRAELRKLGKHGIRTTCVCPYFVTTVRHAPAPRPRPRPRPA